MISKGKKTLIHVAKAQLGLSDAEYMDILHAHGGGVQSSRDLTNTTFETVLAHFQHLGFKTKKKPRRGKNVSADKRRLMSKIDAIRRDMSLPWSYVDKMAQKICKVGFVEWCGPEGLHKIVAALTYHQQRERSGKAAAR